MFYTVASINRQDVTHKLNIYPLISIHSLSHNDITLLHIEFTLIFNNLLFILYKIYMFVYFITFS